jgi:hypothetical protein
LLVSDELFLQPKKPISTNKKKNLILPIENKETPIKKRCRKMFSRKKNKSQKYRHPTLDIKDNIISSITS